MRKRYHRNIMMKTMDQPLKEAGLHSTGGLRTISLLSNKRAQKTQLKVMITSKSENDGLAS
jgi:hypothetical protein